MIFQFTERKNLLFCYQFMLLFFRQIHDFKLSDVASSEACVMESSAIGRKKTVNYIKKVSNRHPKRRSKTIATIFINYFLLREIMESRSLWVLLNSFFLTEICYCDDQESDLMFFFVDFLTKMCFSSENKRVVDM